MDFGEAPPEAPGFQPRLEVMAELNRLRTGARVLVLSADGGPGAGRTQLAAAYARACSADGWTVAWINAGSPFGVVRALADLARMLGLSWDGNDERQAGQAVRQWLEDDRARGLIVFDDLTDAGQVRPFLPTRGGGHVLVTSDDVTAVALGTVVPVGRFTWAEVAAFLAARTGLDDPDGADRLAGAVDAHALALAAASSVIRAEGLTYAGYLLRLRDIVDRDPPHLAGHRNVVTATAHLALDMVQADLPPTSGQVLELLSVLSPAGIPASLQGAGTAADAEAGTVALERLAATGLVTRTSDNAIVSAHPAVLGVVRERLAAAGRLHSVLHNAIELLDAHAVALWPIRFRDRSAVHDLVAQIAALRAAALAEPDDSGQRELVRLQWWASTFVNELGDSPFIASSVALTLAADEARLLGHDHPETLAARDNVAVTYRINGRAEEAIAEHELVLTDRRRILGPDHPDTLASTNNLALAYRSAGRTGEAIALYERNLADRERVLGPDHPSTLASQNNLALAYRSAGRTGEAILLHEVALAGRERVLGPDNPDTLASRNNLALAYRTAGRAAEAITLLEATVQARQRVLGIDHPGTATSLDNLARAYRSVGRIEEAATLIRQFPRARQRPPSRGNRFASVLTIDDLVLFLAASGLGHREIAVRVAAQHGHELAPDTIAAMIGQAQAQRAQWQGRPLDSAYAALFVDSVPVTIRAERTARRVVWLVVGVTVAGERDTIGLWIEDGGPLSARLKLFADISARGTQDVGLVVDDCLDPAADTVWPGAVVTPSLTRLIQRTATKEVRLVSGRDANEMLRDLKPVYLAAQESEARAQLKQCRAKWDDRYPQVVSDWQDSWPALASILRLDPAVRMMAVANAVEALGSRFGRFLRAKGVFSSEDAALDHLYLVLDNLDPTGHARVRWARRWQPWLDATNGTRW